MPTEKVERKLAAILSADVKDYSRLMGEDEAATVHTLHTHRQVIDSLIHQHRGRIVNTAGDSVLAEFASAVDAVQCAVAIQYALKAKNAALLPERRMEFRLGLNVGDVVIDGDQLHGDGVNVAARLQGLADPGGVFLSGTVYDQIENKLSLQYEDLGEQAVKNIVKPVRVWRVVMDEAAAALAAAQAALRQARHEREPDEVGAGFKPAPSDSPGQQKRWMPIARLPRTVALAGIGLLLLAGIVVGVQYLSVRLPVSSANIPPEQTKALLLPDKPSIVVLPFVNMSGDPGQEYFSDGMTEELTASLSRLSSLFVISRNSAFFYKGKAVKMPDLSKELGVKYVLEGSLRKAGDQVRITTQLIDATTDHHLWSERYDRSLKDIFALQDEIVQKIATTLELQLPFWEGGYQLRRHTDNLEAYDFYLRGLESIGRAILETKKEANGQARQMFERALELDPTYAEAYAELGWTYFNEWWFQWNLNRAQTLERALELLQRAITLDDSLPIPHCILAQMYLWNKQHDQAIAEIRRAIALDPNFSDNYLELGVILVFAGQPEEAIKSIKMGMRLNPRYSGAYPGNLGWAYRVAGRREEALAPLQEALTLAPNFLPTHVVLAGCYAELGRQEEAQAQAAEVLRLNPQFSMEAWGRMLPYKDPATLERMLASLRKAGLK